MNQPYTMTVAKAADAIRQFKPTIVYPYHYGDGAKADLEELKRLIGTGRRGNPGSGLVSGKVSAFPEFRVPRLTRYGISRRIGHYTTDAVKPKPIPKGARS